MQGGFNSLELKKVAIHIELSTRRSN